MKNYTITVNGNVYNVTVEEGSTREVSIPVTPIAAAPNAPINKVSTEGVGKVKVTSPMPGKILGVKAGVGQTVKKGEVIFILEAMKMENEVVAPEDGTIASISVATGDSVEAGDVLATLN